METTITNALSKAVDYATYRTTLTNLIAEGKSSGDEQSEEILNYSKLNDSRLNRLDKTMKVDADIQTKIQAIKSPYTWLVLSEGWCGDAAQILPIMNKMAELSSNIDFKVVFRDENPELMDQFLTNGGKAIPKLLILNSEHKVVADWGPRPAGAVKLIVDYKAEHGVVDEPAKAALQMWYLHDKGLSTQQELLDMMSDVESAK